MKPVFKKRFFLYLIVFFVSLFLFSNQVKAAGLVPCGGTGEPACQLCHLFLMLEGIIRFVIYGIVPSIATLMLVIGGIWFFTAAENPEAKNKAIKIINSTILGLVIIYSAWLLIGMIFSAIGVAGWTGLTSWFQLNIPCPLVP